MTRAEKVTKDSVDYRNGTPARHCGICVMYRTPNKCSKVAGWIAASAVCKLFERKPQ